LGTSIATSSKACAEPKLTWKYKPVACARLVLKRVVSLPSSALAGASAALEGALVLATQAVRAKAVPLTDAEQFEPGTLVVVVVGVVVVVVGFVVVVVGFVVVVVGFVVVVVGFVVVVVGFVVVVVDVVVVPAAEAAGMVGARKQAMVASVAASAVTAAAPQP
jgi:hypothetical protein